MLQLQPLSRGESDLLLAGALGGDLDPDCARRLWEFTQGNVLQLRHLIDQEVAAQRLATETGVWNWAGDLEVSSTLIDLIDTQVGAVPGEVLDVVDMVAVAEPLDLGLLSTLVRQRRDRVRRAPGPDRHHASSVIARRSGSVIRSTGRCDATGRDRCG